MRLSAYSDPFGGDINLAELHHKNLVPKVYRNGKELKYCLLADEERGFALVLRTDTHDNFIIKGDEVAQRRVTGHIQIVVRHVT